MGTWGNPPWGTFVPWTSLGTEVRARAASEEAGIHHPAGRRAGSRSSSEEADGPCRSASAAPKGRGTGSRCRHREESPEGLRCFSVEHPSSLNPGGFGDDLVDSEESERARGWRLALAAVFRRTCDFVERVSQRRATRLPRVPEGIRSRTGTEGLGAGSLVAGSSEEPPMTSCREQVSGLSNRGSPGRGRCRLDSERDRSRS